MTVPGSGRELLDHVESAAAVVAVEAGANNLFDAGLERLDGSVGEPLRCKFAQARVVGRVEIEHRGVVDAHHRPPARGKADHLHQEGIHPHVARESGIAEHLADFVVAQDHPAPLLIGAHDGLTIQEDAVALVGVLAHRIPSECRVCFR